MSNLPSPTKVSGKFNAIYEAYYKLLDPKGLGTIEAMVAAKFLKKSGLSDVVLSRIWDLSDPTGRGFLDKEGLFVSLKLVALAQAGNDINMRNIFIEPPNPPKVGEIPKITPPKILTVLPHTQDWTIGPADRTRYENLFASLQPVEGLLPGNKVRSVLMDSKLPLDALSRIWDLADQDKDGSLDKHEFLVAMHLVYLALDKKTIPASLPVELQRPRQTDEFVASFPADIAPPPVPPLPSVAAAAVPAAHHIAPLIPPMPMRPAAVPAPLIPTDLLIQTGPLIAQPIAHAAPVVVDWVVSAMDKQRFDVMFKRSDLDNDGLVSGLEIKDVFLQSGIPQPCLAQIWALCDTAQSGKLTAEQFALAMWMVERKRMGYEPPECLTGNMVPPSQRGPAPVVGAAADLVGLGDLMQPAPTEQPYANPELAMIAKEIEELVRERRQLETEVTQREADIRIKNGEVRSLQVELDTLAATLKQLENQKGEAQKRLDDLKAQVNKIRDKCQKQEETIRDMEGEVDSKRGELQKLKDEETSLEREYDNNKQELDKVSQSLQDTKLQISQIKSMVTQLQESQRQMSDALSICKSAIETNNPTLVSDYTLKLEPEFRDVKTALEKKDEKPNDPDTTEAYHPNGFTPSDAFGPNTTSASSKFTAFDDSSFGNTFGQSRNDDPFHGSSTTLTTAAADPFGDKSGNKAITPDPNKDDFGSDPFAILHAPTSASQIVSPGGHLKSGGGPPPRPESPSPALPPKKAKQPPPRPAPPRPSMGPTPTRPEPPSSHGFGGAPTGGSGFADFANFDDITPMPPSQASTSTINTITIPSTNPTPAASGVAAPSANVTSADFVVDPFKDYRYEDPFNIKDPFDDDVDPITDTFASIVAVAPSSPPIATTNNNPSTASSASLPSSNATPVPSAFNAAKPSTSPDFANFNNQFGATTSATRTSDFFDAFHDNFNKNVSPANSSHTIPTEGNVTNTSNGTAADTAFGGDGASGKFDPFGVPSDSNSAKVDNSFAANFNNDFFANGFEDEFAKVKVQNANANVSTTVANKFDPFGLTTQQNGNGNGFGSEADPFAAEARFDDNFGATAKADGFLTNAFASGASSAKKSNNNGGGAAAVGGGESLKSSRYAADYSQGETFDKDLQETLKRSLVDQ